MPGQELLVGVRGIGLARLLPLAILGKLREAAAGGGDQLAVGMLLEKLGVALNGIGSLGRAPILLLTAAGTETDQRNSKSGNFSCAECEHRQHPSPRGRG